MDHPFRQRNGERIHPVPQSRSRFLPIETVRGFTVFARFRAVIVSSIWDDEAVYEAVEEAVVAEAEAAPASEKKRMGL
jgi:hypothetical protein